MKNTLIAIFCMALVSCSSYLQKSPCSNLNENMTENMTKYYQECKLYENEQKCLDETMDVFCHDDTSWHLMRMAIQNMSYTDTNLKS